MEFYNKSDLESLRKSELNQNDQLELYALLGINKPIIKIIKLTKKSVYDVDGKKYPYPSKSAGYTIFDSQSQAWRKFRKLYMDRKQYILDNFEYEMNQLSQAESILNKCLEDNPEYIV